MTEPINLAKLAEPFPAEDIEWRVAQSGMGKSGPWCKCFAYVTARAIQARLDEVCGPANWKNEPPIIQTLREGVTSFTVGISIRIDGEWITKWDCAELPIPEKGSGNRIDPAKSGFSNASKRAGAQWGIFRYGYYLEEAFAEISENGGKGWTYAKLPDKHGGGTYYWRPPTLPAWALPQEKEAEIRLTDLDLLKKAWRLKFAPDTTNAADLREGFARFVETVVGHFPMADFKFWTRDALERVSERIKNHDTARGVSSDVPFDG